MEIASALYNGLGSTFVSSKACPMDSLRLLQAESCNNNSEEEN